MKRRAAQTVTVRLNIFLETNAYNKAEVARKANISPDDFYMMLNNQKIMNADDFVSVCTALNKIPSEIISVPLPSASTN